MITTSISIIFLCTCPAFSPPPPPPLTTSPLSHPCRRVHNYRPQRCIPPIALLPASRPLLPLTIAAEPVSLHHLRQPCRQFYRTPSPRRLYWDVHQCRTRELDLFTRRRFTRPRPERVPECKQPRPTKHPLDRQDLLRHHRLRWAHVCPSTPAPL